MARRIEFAWAAGLFEGEGSCFVGGKGNRQPRVALNMTDEDVVRRFAATIGRGNVRFYERPEPNQPVWQWSVQSAADVLYALGLLWPYLGERRRASATEVLERASKMCEDKGFCKRGHDLSLPEHLYVHQKTGKRHCRTCRREYQQRWLSRPVA